jgi:hypothetical protein
VHMNTVHSQNHWVCGLCPSYNYKTQRFGNWIYFHLQARGERHLLCWVSYKELTSINRPVIEVISNFTQFLFVNYFRDFTYLLHCYSVSDIKGGTYTENRVLGNSWTEEG